MLPFHQIWATMENAASEGRKVQSLKNSPKASSKKGSSKKIKKKSKRNTQKTPTKRVTETLEEEDDQSVNKKVEKPAEKKNSNEGEKRRAKSAQKAEKTSITAPSKQGTLQDEYPTKFMDWVLKIHTNEGFERFFKQNLANYIPPAKLFKFTAFTENKKKNRYQDIVCLDASRVVLKTDENNSSDYIHANYVTFPNFDRKFIATQYPLDNTIEDFWRMVHNEGVDTIIALMNPQGDPDIPELDPSRQAKPKPDPKPRKFFRFIKSSNTVSSQMEKEVQLTYWPLTEGGYATHGKFSLTTRKVEQSTIKYSPTIYTLDLVPEGCSNGLFVKLINYPSWGRGCVPSSPRVVLKIIKKVREVDPLQSGPVVVHCDTGINRTAMIILIDVIISRIYTKVDVDVVELFKELRNQRASCVQHHFQLMYVLYAVAEYIRLKSCSKKQNEELAAKVKRFQDDVMKDFKGIIAKEPPVTTNTKE